MLILQETARIVLIGVGATVVLDIWLSLLKRMGVPTLNFAFIGRWVGHSLRGRFRQPSIGKAQPVAGELALGWFTHYAVGVVFAALLVCLQGTAWTKAPSILPAIAVGVFTVLVPLFVMQPAMGAGFAASKTPSPVKSCIRSVINHTVFGAGLYVSAVVVAWVAR
jgi:hypothetical protein